MGNSSNDKLSSSLSGYTSIANFRDFLLAVGTDGRICKLTATGQIVQTNTSYSQKLNSVYADNLNVIITGNSGTILMSSDGEGFVQAKTNITNNINGITFFNGKYFACADSGTILSSQNGKQWNNETIGVKGNIVSISANNSLLIAITNTGEIIKSDDGNNWKIIDYNSKYDGYSPKCWLNKVLVTPQSIVVIGSHEDGSPAILVSVLGNVWSERSTICKNEQGQSNYLTSMPNGIVYDTDRDEFIFACDNGELFVLPSCTKCNKLYKISDDNLEALAITANSLVIVGDKFSIQIQN